MLADFEKQLPKITVVMENNCMFVQIPAYALVVGEGGGVVGGEGLLGIYTDWCIKSFKPWIIGVN